MPLHQKKLKYWRDKHMKTTTIETKKAVTLDLSPITLFVTGKNDKELLENAKIAFIEEISKKFPSLSYSINDANALTMQTIRVGQIVECDKGIGIVISKAQKRVRVTLTGQRTLSGTPELFTPSSASFEEARSKRPSFNKDEWFEGSSGYIKVANKIESVVVGKRGNLKTKLYIVGTDEYINVTESQLKRFLKDEKSEVQ